MTLAILIEQDPRYAAKQVNASSRPREDRLHVRLRIESKPEQPGVAENHQEGVALSSGKAELGEIQPVPGGQFGLERTGGSGAGPGRTCVT